MAEEGWRRSGRWSQLFARAKGAPEPVLDWSFLALVA